MRIDILTIFPLMFDAVMSTSIIGIARDKGALDVRIHDLRQWASDKHNTVDDIPYGGGAGMVMKPEPLFMAVEELAGGDLESFRQTTPIILTCPKGTPFTQEMAAGLSVNERLVIICGRYEGVDERVREHLATEMISIGDYVLSGGEIPAMAIVDALTRLIPGVLGGEASLDEESFTAGLLEYPQYTRPPVWRGHAVPEILLSGHHANIAKWRRHQSLLWTYRYRPDLFGNIVLSEEDELWLSENCGYQPD